MKLRLLLADDHTLVREGLKRLIEDQPDLQVVAEAGDGLLAVRLARELVPDVALIDVSMPGLDGTQVAQMIAAACPQVKVIALTRHDDASFVQRLFAAGAAGYVLKQSASSELARAIRAVAAGERYLDRSMRPAQNEPAGQVAAAPPAFGDTPLTVEEEQVLRLVATAHTSQEIAHALAMDPAQVLAVRAQAMSKAGLAGRAAIVRFAEARGWR